MHTEKPFLPTLFLIPFVFLALFRGNLRGQEKVSIPPIPKVKEIFPDLRPLVPMAESNPLVLAFHPKPFTIVVGGKEKKKTVRFFTGLVMVNAPPEVVQKKVMDFSHYPEFLAQIALSEVLKENPEIPQWKVKIKMEFDFKIISLSTKYTGVFQKEGDDLIWMAIEGDTEGSLGRWEFIPVDGKTLLSYTTFINEEEAGFILRTIFRAQPDLKLALPSSTVAVTVRSVKEALEGKNKETPFLRTVTIPLFTKKELPLDLLVEICKKGTLIQVFPEGKMKLPDQTVTLQFVTAIGYVNAEYKKTKDLGSDLKRYKEFFPQVEEVKIKHLSEKEMEVDWHLGLKFGILTVPIWYRHRYTWLDPSVLIYRRIAGDLEFIYGAYEWVPVGDKTLYFFTAAATVGKHGSTIAKFSELVPNSHMILGISSTAIILERQLPWIEGTIGKSAGKEE